MEGGNGGGGSCWSYREAGSTVSSSRSGTIVSTASTSRSSASRHSTAISAEHGAMLEDLGIYYGDEVVLHEEAKEEQIRSMVQDFFFRARVQELSGAPSADYSTNGGDMRVLQRWFMELGVGWVLRLADGASGWKWKHEDAQIWIRALGNITETICSSAPLLFARRTSIGVGLAIICEEEEADSSSCNNLDLFQFARFVKETMLRMVAFVDVVAVLDRNSITSENLMSNGTRRALYQKISILLLIHNALSEALSQIKASFHSLGNAEIGRVRDEMLNLLYANGVKVCEVICSTLEQISAGITQLMERMAATITPQGSSGIHKVTWSAMDHITFLLDNHLTLVTKLLEAHHSSLRKRLNTLFNMILEMASSLEEKLVVLSKSFLDEDLRFIFLLNNLGFMREQLQHSHLQEFGLHLSFKVNDYMERYLHVSWEPVLSCLLDTSPLCFHINYSSLSKFESEFQKTYTTHKLWKVPNPELRRSLRTAITKKIVPRYTRYIEDNGVTTVKMGPYELKEMLQELFEAE